MFEKSTFDLYMANEVTLDEVIEAYESVEKIAKKADLEKMLSNKAMQKFMSFDTGVEVEVLVSQTQKLLALY